MFKFQKKLSSFGEIEVSDATVYGGDHERRKIEEPIGLVNLRRFLGVVLGIIFILGFRTAYLQIAKGAYYLKQAEKNRINKVVIRSPRGIIADSQNRPLVNNVASFDMVIVPAFLPQGFADRKLIINDCLTRLNFPLADREKILEEMDLNPNSFKPYLLREDISREEAIQVELLGDQCSGITTEKSARRNYETPYAFAHLMGYTGKVQKEDLERDDSYLMTDETGKAGIEESWEQELRGEHGFRFVEVDSSGKSLRELEEELPKPGRRLVLGIDKDIQEKLYTALKDVSEKNEAKRGAAVAIDPRNGLIRAIVSLPSYDNNLFAGKISQEDYSNLLNNSDKPMLNRAIGGVYPPGSTIKPLVATAALEEGVVKEDTTFDCGGAIHVGSWRFGDWKTHGSGIDIRKAIAQSCDVYFYIVGGGYGETAGLSMDRMGSWENLFGLGQPTGIALDGERTGLIPSPEWKLETKNERWYIGNTYHASIGQGDLSATPLQIANYIAAVANGGTLYKPQIVDKILDEETGDLVEDVAPVILKSNLASKHDLEVVREGMRQTVEAGTAQSLKELEHGICGKTGTAQVGGTEKTHSWFTGFASFDNPEVVIAVIVEEGGESTDTAVPVAKEFFKAYFGLND